MQFDKPKVTIDLEEYQYLKEQVDQLEKERNSGGYYDAARIILWAFSVRDIRDGDIKSFLSQHGIEYYITGGVARCPSYEDIQIHLKSKEK